MYDQHGIAGDDPGLEYPIKILWADQTSGFWEPLVALDRHTFELMRSALVHDFCVSDKLQELLIALKTRKLFGQLFHRLDRVHGIERSTNHGYGMIRVGIVKHLFTSRSGLRDIDRRPHAAVSQFAVKNQLHVSRTLELLENEFVHS